MTYDAEAETATGTGPEAAMEPGAGTGPESAMEPGAAQATGTVTEAATESAARAARKSRSRRLKRPFVPVTVVAAAAALLAGCSGGGPQAEPTGPPPAKTPPKESEAPTPDSFAPYVDTSLKPSFDLVRSAEETGVKEYNLAFVSPGGGKCVPRWGGRQKLTGDPVAAQADELRDKGGDIRISFGGQSGNELARACSSVDRLTAAYTEVIDAYDLTKLDFDLEGPALTDKKANERRSQAIVRLQRQHPNLNISFTLPVMPSGLNADALAVLKNVQQNGARINRVNIMAMDYGTYYDGDMGKYAVQAATAAHKQIQPALGIEDEEEAWDSLAVTPMIGVNDVKGEVFRPQDAAELKKFADSKELGALSMWSATRDRPCPDGANSKAQATCSGITERADAFAKALTG